MTTTPSCFFDRVAMRSIGLVSVRTRGVFLATGILFGVGVSGQGPSREDGDARIADPTVKHTGHRVLQGHLDTWRQFRNAGWAEARQQTRFYEHVVRDRPDWPVDPWGAEANPDNPPTITPQAPPKARAGDQREALEARMNELRERHRALKRVLDASGGNAAAREEGPTGQRRGGGRGGGSRGTQRGSCRSGRPRFPTRCASSRRA
jgi:hypothetical protein